MKMTELNGWRVVLGLLGVGTLVGTVELAHAQSTYSQHNLVSDLPGMADNTDTNLLNPWGIAFSPTGPFWINDNHSGLSTVYNSTGAVQSLVVTVPPPGGGTPPAAPTGIVFNNTTNFAVSAGTAAKFIFATEDGTISAWASGTEAALKVDNSGANAIYKGLAMGSVHGSNYLYATDFHNGKVDVFDGEFNPVSWPGAFTDSNVPTGFAPFGVETMGTNVFVSYAKQDAAAEDDDPGLGNGYVDIYDTGGNWVRRLISNGALNSPWAMVMAPTSFGLFGGELLVGNFGDGTINAYDPASGLWIGMLKDTNGAPISIVGLWDLKFGNGGNAGSTNTLYFTAGIAGTGSVEDHGLFGAFSVAVPFQPPATANVSVVNYQFIPATANINVNDKVVWTWESGAFNHNVTSTSTPQAWPATATENGPFTFTNTFGTAGTYPYECTVHAFRGMTGSIIVGAPNMPPAVLLFSPATGAVLAAPASVTLRAAAGDADGVVTNVQFQMGSTVLTNEVAGPYSVVVSNLAAGSCSLSAVATDNGGLKVTNSVSIIVVTPTVTVVSNPTLLAHGNFQLSYLVNPGLTYVVQMSTDLASGQWTSLVTNTASSNPAMFVDLHATNSAAFYRIVRLPNP